MGHYKAEEVSFNGQHFYIGLDVHKKSWSVNIRNCEMSLKSFSMNPSPELLHHHLEKHYPGGTYHVVYEAGFSGFWIQRRFSALGIDCIVVNPADVPTSHKEKIRKNDSVDAFKLAREIEKGEMEPIYIPEPHQQHLRSLCRLYRRVIQNSTRTKNRITSLLAYNGIPVPHHSSNWSAAFIAELRTLPLDDGPAKDYLTFCLDELMGHRARKLQIIRKLRVFIRTNPGYNTVKHLMSIRGIGFQSALTLFTEIVDMRRFPTFDKLKAFVGLIPSCHSSGETDITGSLTPRRNPHLRFVLIEAAWAAVGKDPALLAAYHKMITRMKKQNAIIRIASKLLSRIRYVWLNACPYPCSAA